MIYALDLNVVGGMEQPSNPTENTVWISTNDTITNWSICVDYPEWPMEGEVFMKVAENATNLIKPASNANIYVRISTIYQLQRNEWVVVEGMLYSNGSWSDMSQHLYHLGTYSGLTMWTYGGAGSCVDYTDYFRVNAKTGGWDTSSWPGYRHTGLLDLTYVDKVRFIITKPKVSNSSTLFYISVSTNTNSHANCYTKAAVRKSWGSQATFIRQVHDLDVSSLTGNYYINIGTNVPINAGGGGYFDFYSVSLL